ncbi:MAG: acetate/propionate family kinase [Eubacteriales bacterium]|nr:acetate/propionate family kinase [Eubacteriales bacterium]
MKLLVCNVGSTSLKFKLFAMPGDFVMSEGKVERVGSLTDAIFHYQKTGAEKIHKENISVPSYTAGIQMFLNLLVDSEQGALKDLAEIERIGFKTVLSKNHYGVHELTDEVLDGMEQYNSIAGSHNVPYLTAIRLFRDVAPNAKLIGVFETHFHQTIPLERKLYGIPYDWYETYGIQKMGYHSASHSFVAQTLEDIFENTGKTISCHLGGSCSICAIDNGKSVDNSWGISLQSGLPHSNRTGDLDPFVIPFLLKEGLSLEEITEGLTKRGGLLGISGLSNDVRDLEYAEEENNDARAKLALDVFVTNIVRYIGAYYAELGGLDHLVFTGGIGEHSGHIREKVCKAIEHLGIKLNRPANYACRKNAIISAAGSKVMVHVIAQNEELIVARKTFDFEN